MARLPNFLFIGPDKSGSTWLYEVLRAHPMCFVPAIKDIYFFDRHYTRGLNWYARFFRSAPPEAVAVGELSHDYLFEPLAAERIAHDLPDVTLLTCLREPLERSFSHYLYLVRSGLTRVTFDEALDEFPELVDRSRYAEHLMVYLDRFPKGHVHVLWFDDLQRDPEYFARNVFEVLGVPFFDGFDYRATALPASRPRNWVIARSLKMGANTMRRIGAPAIVGRAKRSRWAKALYIPYEKGDKPKPSASATSRLRDAVRDDVERLERLLNVELSRWRATGTV